MSHFDEFEILYKKHQNQGKKVLGLTLGLILIISAFVAMDLVRVEPILLYLIAMILVIFYTVRTRVESKQMDKLRRFLKKEKQVDILKNQELLFYLDYQLSKDSTVTLGKVTDEQAKSNLIEKIQMFCEEYEASKQLTNF